MNLKLGKREGNNYYLLDNTRLDKHEWTKKVHEQIVKRGDEAIYNGLYEISSVIHRIKEDAELTALFYYVSEMYNDNSWCQSVGYRPVVKNLNGKFVEKQLAFF